MDTTTVLFALAFYAASFALLVGLGAKIRQYLRTPAPLKIPTTPAPTTRRGVVARMAREVFLFESLFKATKWTWLFGWVFHVALTLVVVRHLRYFSEPVWWWVSLAQPLGLYAGFAMLIGLIGLWARRLFIARIRYISAPSDHLMLALIVGIGLSGLSMKYLAHTDVVAVKVFFLGLFRFDVQPLPTDPALLIHLSLVLALMFIFPFSKLLHAPGVFFSPTRNQVDNPRERRHLADWARHLERR
ncbi:MAG: nitrate reductase [Chromatiales bacterium]|jgi:nitrate reductase gamma subunit|nr:nitrate reductase [Chromatiales bacterium]